jgi:hypothetical protein
MLVVELSNHPGDMLSAATRRRETAGKRALASHQDQYRARVQTMRVKRAQHAWWTWAAPPARRVEAKRQVPRRPVPESGSTDLEEKLKAGIAGEQLVAVQLGRALDDDWTLLRGYHNRRGEIDHVLLGPGGLFAIEVKNLNATVHVDGDSWRAGARPPSVEGRRLPEPDGPARNVGQVLADPAPQLTRPKPVRPQAVHRSPAPDPARPRVQLQTPPAGPPPLNRMPSIMAIWLRQREGTWRAAISCGCLTRWAAGWRISLRPAR